MKLNDSYFNSAPYNTTVWRSLVMCQEVGHNVRVQPWAAEETTKVSPSTAPRRLTWVPFSSEPAPTRASDGSTQGSLAPAL